MGRRGDGDFCIRQKRHAPPREHFPDSSATGKTPKSPLAQFPQHTATGTGRDLEPAGDGRRRHTGNSLADGAALRCVARRFRHLEVDATALFRTPRADGTLFGHACLCALAHLSEVLEGGDGADDGLHRLERTIAEFFLWHHHGLCRQEIRFDTPTRKRTGAHGQRRHAQQRHDEAGV